MAPGLRRAACRLLRVSLRTGRLLASTGRVEARVYGPRAELGVGTWRG